jgi:hypothetical protein
LSAISVDLAIRQQQTRGCDAVLASLSGMGRYGTEKTGTASRIQGLIAVNEFVQWLRRAAGCCSLQPRARLPLIWRRWNRPRPYCNSARLVRAGLLADCVGHITGGSRKGSPLLVHAARFRIDTLGNNPSVPSACFQDFERAFPSHGER